MFCIRISARVGTPDRRLFDGLTSIKKCVGEVSLYFQLQLNTLGILTFWRRNYFFFKFSTLIFKM